MKTLTEILTERRSTRKFDGRVPSREDVRKLLDLAFMAPSSKNTRSTRFMVLDDAGTLAKVSEMRDSGSAFLADAPCAVMVLGDTATDLWLDNAAISATVLQLAAQEAGMVSCWVHVNDRPRHSRPQTGADNLLPGNLLPGAEAIDYGETAEDFLRTFLPVPAEWRPLCVVALGYTDEPARPRTVRDNAEKVLWV